LLDRIWMKNLHNALLLKQLYQLKQLGYRYTDISLSTYQSSELHLPSTLEELKKQAQSCHLCQLSKSRESVMFGEGNPNADILFIGEAPNSTEESGRVLFVGRAGEMLTNMIEKVLLISRSDVYLTNVVKCRPQNNRIPTPTEAHSCLPYLKKEIEVIKPKIIVTLGETAYHYLTGDDLTITQVRGTINKQESYTIVPTYHPNYLLRNPSAKKESFADMKLIKHLMEELCIS